MPHPSITAQTYPHKPAVIMGASGEMVTYSELDKRSNQGAHLFRSLGVGPGDAIAIFMDNSPRYFEVLWAAQRAGIGSGRIIHKTDPSFVPSDRHGFR